LQCTFHTLIGSLWHYQTTKHVEFDKHRLLSSRRAKYQVTLFSSDTIATWNSTWEEFPWSFLSNNKVLEEEAKDC